MGPPNPQFIPPNSQMSSNSQHQMPPNPFQVPANPWEWWNNPYSYGPPMPGLYEPNFRDDASQKRFVFRKTDWVRILL